MAEESAEADQSVSGSTGSQDSGAAGGQIVRRSTWQGAMAALAYLKQAEKERKLKQRKSDATSSLVLGCAVLVACLIPFLPPSTAIILFAIDVIFVASVVYYALNRLGVVTALPLEKAAIARELLLAAAVFGFCLAANLFGMISLLSRMISTAH